MRNRTRDRNEKFVLSLLADLPEPDDIYAGYWMHETAIAELVFGSQTRGARRKTRKLLKGLEDLGFVERREWKLGVSWQLFGRSDKCCQE